jgi:hypothetical protein
VRFRCCVVVGLALTLVSNESALAQETGATPGVGAIAKEMPRDLWRFLALDTAIVLGVGGAAAGIAHIWDDERFFLPVRPLGE